MKQAGYSKRAYGRSSERQRQPHTKQSSNGTSTEGKMRGNPQQNVEKYLTLARDATALGDPISAENYYQFADHYYRLVAASRPPRPSTYRKREEDRENVHEERESVRENEGVIESVTEAEPISPSKQEKNWLE